MRRRERVYQEEQRLEQWMVQIEQDERQQMDFPTERLTRERSQAIRDHRRYLKKDRRFRNIAPRVLETRRKRRSLSISAFR
jgi:hypothetical protein